MIPQVIDMEETSGRGKDKAKIFHIRFQFCYESSKIFNKKVSDYFLVFILKKLENCDNKKKYSILFKIVIMLFMVHYEIQNIILNARNLKVRKNIDLRMFFTIKLFLTNASHQFLKNGKILINYTEKKILLNL